MSSRPLITIRAGRCEQDGTTVMPIETPGLLYVYINPEDELMHLAWKPRSAVSPDEDNDFIVFPGDAEFVPYDKENSAPSNGRVYVLKFSSSSLRKFFWLQSKSEKEDDLAFHSPRDLGWARRINTLLQEGAEGGDEEMRDAPPEEPTPAASATTQQPQSQPQSQIHQNQQGGTPDLMSLLRSIQVPTQHQQQSSRTAILSLTDLLSPKNTLPILYRPDLSTLLPTLKENLPQDLFPPNASERETIKILEKVLRSPQFSQACAGLTGALREGALPVMAESLGLDIRGVEHLGVGGLVEGVKRKVEEEGREEDADVVL